MDNLIHLFKAGGWVMYPLALLLLSSVYVILDRIVVFRQAGVIQTELLDEVVDMCERGEYTAALELCGTKKGPLAAALESILENRNKPVSDVERGVQEVAEPYFIALEARMAVLDTTTTISPLLGLLGTLFGMIGTFKTIAASANQSANDAVLGGVGEALYATATGLSIAVVCFVAYNAFSSRIRYVVGETESSATRLINVLRGLGLLQGVSEKQDAVTVGTGR